MADGAGQQPAVHYGGNRIEVENLQLVERGSADRRRRRGRLADRVAAACAPSNVDVAQLDHLLLGENDSPAASTPTATISVRSTQPRVEGRLHA